MKMNFTILLGVLVLMAGVSILAQALFNIHLPLVRTAFALFIIFFGFRMLLDAWAPKSSSTAASGAAMMSEQRFAPTETASHLKYDVVFGRGIVDLTQLPRPEKPMLVEVNSVFSTTEVFIDPTWPVVVEGSSAFGEVRMPDSTTANFGMASYRSRGVAEAVVRLRVNAVFGNCVVLERPHEDSSTPTRVSVVPP